MAETSTTDQGDRVATVAVLAPVLLIVISILTVPFMVWESFAINQVLSWHLPAYSIGVVKTTAAVMVIRTVMNRPQDKSLKWYEPFLHSIGVGVVLLVAGWVLLLVGR